MSKDLLQKVLQQAQTPVWIGGIRDGLSIPVSTIDGNILDVELENTGYVDGNNSTTDPLTAPGQIYLGSSTEVVKNSSIIISIFSDVPSATDGVEIQFSNNGSTWYTSDEYTYENNNVLKTWAVQTVLQYFRIKYTNGSVGQSVFLISVIIKQIADVTSSHRVSDEVSGQDDAALTTTVIKARNTATDRYNNVDATPEGELRVSVVTPLGSLPVSELTTLHDGKILGFIDSRIFETAGTGTGTFTNNKYNMAVTAGQWSIITTKRHLQYFSGKSQKVELTFDNFAPEANVVKRVGYFSSSTISPYSSTLDGLWLESDGSSISIKSSRVGVLTLDVDIVDWTGYDRLGEYQTLSTWDNFTVIEFNFLWLGGAYIELRMITQSGFVIGHNFIYAGTAQDTFMKSPNQPVRYEIRSTTGIGDFRYICNQVATLGSLGESGYSSSVNNGITPVTYSTAGTKYPIISVRKKSAFRDVAVKIETLHIFVTSADRILWTLEINPTLSAALTYNDDPSGFFQFANGTGAITVTVAGDIIASDYLTQGEAVPVDIFDTNFLSQLSGQLSGTQDEYVLCITPITNNVDALAAINIRTG